MKKLIVMLALLATSFAQQTGGGGGGSAGGAALQKEYWASAAQASNASLGMNCNTDCPTPSVLNNTNTVYGAAAFSSSVQNTLQTHFVLPASWTAASLTVRVDWRTSSTDNTKAVVWYAQVGCTANGATTDPSFNAVSNSGASSVTATANANVQASITVATLTNCAAGKLMWVKFYRTPTVGSDTLTANTADVIDLFITGT